MLVEFAFFFSVTQPMAWNWLEWQWLMLSCRLSMIHLLNQMVKL